jgi:hypothetical protein
MIAVQAGKGLPNGRRRAREDPMHTFSLVRPSALPGPAKLDTRPPSPLSLLSGPTGPTGFTRHQTPQPGTPVSTPPAHAFGDVSVYAPPRVQAKLTVNRPGDRYEREADAVADQVMRMPAGPDAAPPPVVAERSDSSAVQRLPTVDPSLDDVEIVPEEEEGAGTGVAQTLRPAGAAAGARTLPRPALNGRGGAPLEPGTRGFMETRFGADFSRVRVHADGEAASLNRALNARAFTHRGHIWFGASEYRPETPDGRHVLAHELTHVVQQGAARAGLPIREHVAGEDAERTVQRLGPPGRRTATHVYPWRRSGPSGDNHEVSTGGGSTVNAWIAYSPWKYDWHFWCHGHSTGSFYTHGYSVYSGPSDFGRVVNDEYTPVAPHLARAGDLAVWTSGWDHSAIFTNPVVSGGTLDPAASQLSSKNGPNTLTTTNLASLMAPSLYGPAGVAVFRR